MGQDSRRFPKGQVAKIARKTQSCFMSDLLALLAAPDGQVAERLVVYHDGGCPLCAREIALMRRLDRARLIQFIDAADSAASCPLDRAVLLARFHAVEDGVMLSGAAAFAAMWRAIPVLRPLGLAARRPLVERALEAAYRFFLRYRPRLQGWLR